MLPPQKPAVPANPYTVLGVDRKAGMTDIKRAYFKLVRDFPPEDAPEKFQEIRAAYEQLKSPESRATLPASSRARSRWGASARTFS